MSIDLFPFIFFGMIVLIALICLVKGYHPILGLIDPVYQHGYHVEYCDCCWLSPAKRIKYILDRIESCQQRADKDDADACWRLGQLYWWGVSLNFQPIITSDKKRARELWVKGRDLGSQECRNELVKAERAELAVKQAAAQREAEAVEEKENTARITSLVGLTNIKMTGYLPPTDTVKAGDDLWMESVRSCLTREAVGAAVELLTKGSPAGIDQRHPSFRKEQFLKLAQVKQKLASEIAKWKAEVKVQQKAEKDQKQKVTTQFKADQQSLLDTQYQQQFVTSGGRAMYQTRIEVVEELGALNAAKLGIYPPQVIKENGASLVLNKPDQLVCQECKSMVTYSKLLIMTKPMADEPNKRYTVCKPCSDKMVATGEGFLVVGERPATPYRCEDCGNPTQKPQMQLIPLPYPQHRELWVTCPDCVRRCMTCTTTIPLSHYTQYEQCCHLCHRKQLKEAEFRTRAGISTIAHDSSVVDMDDPTEPEIVE